MSISRSNADGTTISQMSFSAAAADGRVGNAATSKKHYTSPKLTVHGDLANLTRAEEAVDVAGIMVTSKGPV